MSQAAGGFPSAIPDPGTGRARRRLEKMRESYDSKLKAHEKRISEIEAKGRGASADPEKARGRDHARSGRRHQASSLKGGVARPSACRTG
jgi:hypothetical protein